MALPTTLALRIGTYEMLHLRTPDHAAVLHFFPRYLVDIGKHFSVEQNDKDYGARQKWINSFPTALEGELQTKASAMNFFGVHRAFKGRQDTLTHTRGCIQAQLCQISACALATRHAHNNCVLLPRFGVNPPGPNNVWGVAAASGWWAPSARRGASDTWATKCSCSNEGGSHSTPSPPTRKPGARPEIGW